MGILVAGSHSEHPRARQQQRKDHFSDLTPDVVGLEDVEQHLQAADVSQGQLAHLLVDGVVAQGAQRDHSSRLVARLSPGSERTMSLCATYWQPWDEPQASWQRHVLKCTVQA